MCIASVLTLLTQVGGIIWLLVFLGAWGIRNKRKFRFPVKFGFFIIIYLLACYTVIPLMASIGGRTPLPKAKGKSLAPHNILTVWMNRHYVDKALKRELLSLSDGMAKINNGQKVFYLDANFPFFDGFPLLPHLSHNDGKKVDLSFYYKRDGEAVDERPSRSGYGVFEQAKKGEIDQTRLCLASSGTYYNLARFLTFGKKKGLSLDEKRTADLIRKLAALPSAEKIFIEPHLKYRLGLESISKVRFQGCHSVRHDDHIHFQVR